MYAKRSCGPNPPARATMRAISASSSLDTINPPCSFFVLTGRALRAAREEDHPAATIFQRRRGREIKSYSEAPNRRAASEQISPAPSRPAIEGFRTSSGFLRQLPLRHPPPMNLRGGANGQFHRGDGPVFRPLCIENDEI